MAHHHAGIYLIAFAASAAGMLCAFTGAHCLSRRQPLQAAAFTILSAVCFGAALYIAASGE